MTGANVPCLVASFRLALVALLLTCQSRALPWDTPKGVDLTIRTR